MKVSWFLEGLVDERASSWRTEVAPLPFVVGRHEDCQLVLPSAAISTRHAELIADGDGIIVRDLDSTNGTFVNLEKIDSAQALRPGDVIHFADLEFRLVQSLEAAGFRTTMSIDMDAIRVMRETLKHKSEFEQMVRERQLAAEFQPVVDLDSEQLIGFELLGRGDSDKLPRMPEELFAAAESLGLVGELTAGLRDYGATEAGRLPADQLLFLNSHPREVEDPDELVASIQHVRDLLPGRHLVLEIHEMTITDIGEFRSCRDRLGELGVELAFDDFGKGRSRLIELSELSPEFLKFDRSLIKDLDRVSGPRREMIRVLVDLVREIGIKPLAEGIERRGESDICRELGFELGQGYFFGRPQPVAHYLPD